MKSLIEKNLQDQLRQQTEIPVSVEQKAHQAYLKIKSGQVPQEDLIRSPYIWMKRISIALGCAAAAFFLCMFLVITNPVMAETLPGIGNLFRLLQDKVSFFGNFEDYATPLESGEEETSLTEASKSENSTSTPLFSKTQDGLTVTLSEVYADPLAVYLTVLLESEDPFPDTLIDQQGNPVIVMYLQPKFDFLETTDEDAYLPYSLEGEFLNDHSYTCILRLPLQERTDYQDPEGYQEIPDQIHLNLEIQKVVGDLADPQVWDSGYTEEELAAMSDEEWQAVMDQIPEEYRVHPNSHENYWYDGIWEFSLDLTVDKSRTQVIEINETNELGIGLADVILTPYELVVNDLYAEDVPSYDYFCVALDADGNRLPYNDSFGNCAFYTVQDRDISTIDIYILDYIEYMDELKGPDNYNNNENKASEDKWSTLLEQRCYYHTTLNLNPES